ncbi:hypothetical protein KAFR_0E03330 [Kazachstania africana CBS 2517]|uniref:DNA polymerase eta n=1 Tax=Kazachstania africana (strain ATCC 22294 / BCRC 22015 / CBS 2517 / CECT 1963 / NBRC 1671 / NRRL Y-8276) TaxID=1071382 RepID=H2AVT5_KAZAF|nr:hypothetical protein KAFR_0E03330 [Kazachstania africana CBS 2517]CCF58485.1 hypothetical protein KAFR_0E03330 [Kazachstania africana CBS 2517]
MSNYTWNDLVQLNSPTEAYLSPLSCVAHIDVNAFFAQAEQIRCGYSKDDPVVCVQWSSIIAVSYAARSYGISRMDTIESAMQKCDCLIPIHTAVFKKGEDFWQYHDGYGSWNKDRDKQLSPINHKVSLDPYRRESRKLFKIFKEHCDVVEKASVDEVFLDLGRLCFQKLMVTKEENPNSGLSILQEMFIGGNYQLRSHLPAVPDDLKNLEFEGDVYGASTEKPVIEDWDDVIFALGSRITYEIRQIIEDSLGYTTSCGLSRTKSVSKLGSNFKKPNAQTILLNKYVTNFLDENSFEITSFWTLGGVQGRSLHKVLKAPEKGSIRYIRDTWETVGALQETLNSAIKHSNEDKSGLDPTKTLALATKVYEICRGQYCLPLNPKPVVQSMMSNKNMRGGSCSNLVDCISWLEVFSGDLVSRVMELGQEYNKVMVPKTVSVVVTTKLFEVRRKSGPFIHKSSTVNTKDLLSTGTKLMSELDAAYGQGNSSKFYPLINMKMVLSNFEIMDLNKTVIDMFGNQVQVFKSNAGDSNSSSMEPEEVSKDPVFFCEKCSINFPSLQEFQEHKDYHVALKLSESINGMQEDSKNLTIGEKRLLFSNSQRQDSNKRKLSTNSNNTGKKKKAQDDSKSILRFFSK